MCFWKPSSNKKPCREITKAGPVHSKPEALTFLEPTTDHFNVLIMRIIVS